MPHVCINKKTTTCYPENFLDFLFLVSCPCPLISVTRWSEKTRISCLHLHSATSFKNQDSFNIDFKLQRQIYVVTEHNFCRLCMQLKKYCHSYFIYEPQKNYGSTFQRSHIIKRNTENAQRNLASFSKGARLVAKCTNSSLKSQVPCCIFR